MKTIRRFMLSCLLTLGIVVAAGADPCGMVPPISLDGGPSTDIKRIGEQKTYVFRKGDIQTVVIHPGFRGNVDDFGMLIPFPEPPALRKVPDNTFEQLTKAINPPVIPFWIHQILPSGGMSRSKVARPAPMALEMAREDKVVVLKEEAVGMYEIAVLEAGSASALKRWMDDHSYRFPDGMESTCQDYVEDGWCFVAVKTRVGQKSAADPRPGMRKVDPSKPQDANFTGQVQAMGFRFRSEKFEVPMRLSAFNGGDFHNIVYVLAESPVAAANLPKDFVKKQIKGEKLYSNLTDLLPYKIHGGSEDDMSPNMWKQLNLRRDPKPHNGVAAQLFAHDLLASKYSNLSHSFEEKEKQLLDIGESLNLRGGQLDNLHNQILASDREEAQKEAMELIKGMTLTVIEGDFPREVLANENIRFEPYDMANADAIPTAMLETQSESFGASFPSGQSAAGIGVVLSLLALVVVFRSKSKVVIGLLCLAAILPLGMQARARIMTLGEYIQFFDDAEHGREARALVAKQGKAALPHLLKHMKDASNPLVERGYALSIAANHDTPEVRDALKQLSIDKRSRLMVLWSSAALVKQAESPAGLLKLFNDDGGVQPQADLQRPIALKLKDWQSKLNLEQNLDFLVLSQKMGRAANSSPSIQSVIAPALKSASIADLTQLMFESPKQEIRRITAGLLADRARTKPDPVLAAVGEALAISKDAQEAPWAGGPLFLPQFNNLSKTQAIELIGSLVRWSVWQRMSHTRPKPKVFAFPKSLHNNLRSYSLWSKAGGRNAGWRSAMLAEEWIQAYSKVAGRKAAQEILEEQDVPKDMRLWKMIVDS